MKDSVRYHEILEESLKEELIWLLEEFQTLFNSKVENYSERDKKLANDILNYFLDNTYASNSVKLYNMLFDAMENIEKMYSYLF
jgi:poly(3-hydroxyalkanoate) synthetase